MDCREVERTAERKRKRWGATRLSQRQEASLDRPTHDLLTVVVPTSPAVSPS